jgi:hypothetical protein
MRLLSLLRTAQCFRRRLAHLSLQCRIPDSRIAVAVLVRGLTSLHCCCAVIALSTALLEEELGLLAVAQETQMFRTVCEIN